jgi:hypothetical protein
MNWLPWLLACLAIIPIIQLSLDYRVKYVEKDGRTRIHKILRRLIFVFALASLLANPFVGWWNNEQKDRTASEQRKALQNQITTVASNQDNLLSRHKDLVATIATNSAVDPKLQAKVLEFEQRFDVVSDEVFDLQEWSANRDRRKKLAKLHQQEAQKQADAAYKVAVRPIWDSSRPVYEFAVQRLDSILQQMGRKSGEALYRTFVGIPEEPTFGKLGTLNLGTNVNWHFEISAGANPNLTISSKSGANLGLSANPTEVIVSGEGSFPRSNFQQAVEFAVRDLILEVSNRDPSRAKPKN